MKNSEYPKSRTQKRSAYKAAVKAKAVRLGWKPPEVASVIYLKKELSNRQDIKTYHPEDKKQ